jgi:hypothetical protein
VTPEMALCGPGGHARGDGETLTVAESERTLLRQTGPIEVRGTAAGQQFLRPFPGLPATIVGR